MCIMAVLELITLFTVSCAILRHKGEILHVIE